MSATAPTNSKCKLNVDGSVCLEDILNSFNASMREEHAWALCYQAVRYFGEVFERSTADQPVFVCAELRDMYLQPNGAIHANTVRLAGEGRRPCGGVRDMVAGLGMVIFCALDQRSESGEERAVSRDLNELISDMLVEAGEASANGETDDEGIERDAEVAESSAPGAGLSFADVIARCERHLGALSRSQVEAHYKAVVRALVAEAIELSTFLEKIAQGNIIRPSANINSKPSELDQLNYSDWAKFWLQVMCELRTGVKLKKVNYSRAPIEYELTPYEILMKDIRSCRYNLRKILINGDAPSRVRKDAHTIILEFIRSRPPLRKAADRKLPPQQLFLTPREQLLSSIKKGRKLRPTPAPRSIKPLETKPHQTSDNSTAPKPANRRLIKVDFTQFDDDDDDDDEEEAEGDREPPDSPDSCSEPGLWSSETPQSPARLDIYDLATSARLPLPRRHLPRAPPTCHSTPHSRPDSRLSTASSDAESVLADAPPTPERAARWQDAISLDDRLSLTLAEIVHIRAVLTDAELEALPSEGRVRHDAEARKVCFLCLKTRFGLLGPWGQKCTLCKRTVCTRCCARLHLPMEHFASVPVVLLSPGIMRTEEEWGGAGAMAASTISDPGTTTVDGGGGGRGGAGGSLARFRTRAAQIGRSSRLDVGKKANQMIVCHDCKMMVQQIIDTAKVNRSAIRNKTLQSLTLNLSPVF